MQLPICGEPDINGPLKADPEILNEYEYKNTELHKI